MKLISWKELAKLQPYSRQHYKRLEDAGKAPKRVTLSQNRVAWVYDEVQEWIEQFIQKRDQHVPPS